MHETPIEEVPTVTLRVMQAIGITTVLGIVYDVIAYALGGNNATLSKAMQQIGFSWPIVIFIYGGLGAHFFCPEDRQWNGWWTECRPYLFMCLGMLVFRLTWPQVIAPKTVMGALGRQP